MSEHASVDAGVTTPRYGVVVLDGDPVEVCAECGFDGRRFDCDAVVAELRTLPATWAELLADDIPARRRPDARTWCAVEYAVHTAETLAGLAFVTELFLEHDDPVVPLPPVTAPEDIGEDRCSQLQIAALLAQLEDAAIGLADRFSELDQDQLVRPGTTGAIRGDVLGIGRHAVHDAQHHVLDVRRRFAASLLSCHEVHGGS